MTIKIRYFLFSYECLGLNTVKYIIKPVRLNSVPKLDRCTEELILLFILPIFIILSQFLQYFLFLGLFLLVFSLNLVPPVCWNMHTVSRFQVHVDRLEEADILYVCWHWFRMNILEAEVCWNFGLEILTLKFVRLGASRFKSRSLIRGSESDLFSCARDYTMKHLFPLIPRHGYCSLTNHRKSCVFFIESDVYCIWLMNILAHFFKQFLPINQIWNIHCVLYFRVVEFIKISVNKLRIFNINASLAHWDTLTQIILVWLFSQKTNGFHELFTNYQLKIFLITPQLERIPIRD